MKVNIYCTGVGKNKRLSKAFAAGTGFKIVPPAPLLPGAMWCYGAMRGLRPTIQQAIDEGRTWYYADNGYFQRSKDRILKIDGYFRITKNRLQNDGTGEFGRKRWDALGLKIEPWRKTGDHILVCPPDELWGSIWNVDWVKWRRETLEVLSRVTDRPIVVRERAVRSDPTQPFAAALKGAWALVTCTSNAAVEAVLAGVPVFCTHPCAGLTMGSDDLTKIEKPVMPDWRDRWSWSLAANQWSVPEMSSGLCWRELRTR